MNRRTFISASVIGIAGLSGCQETSTQNDEPPTTDESDEIPSETDQEGTATDESDTTSTDESTETGGSEDGQIGPRNEDELPTDPNPDDGYPPAFDTQPEERTIDTAAFDTISVDPNLVEGSSEEIDVPLAPIEAVYYWYARRESRFVDARTESQFELMHIYGSVVNYAMNDISSVIEEWSREDPIVCYCGCPHSLSSARAANLLEAGFEEVYVLDEGFNEWHDRDYPLAGSNIEDRPAEYLIEGTTDPVFAGRVARVSHEPTDEWSTGTIESDGSYSVELHFDDLSIDSILTIDTPQYQVETTLANGLSGVEPPSY